MLFVQGMVSKPSQEPTPEFQIQQEDFPALPGAQSKSLYGKTYLGFQIKHSLIIL